MNDTPTPPAEKTDGMLPARTCSGFFIVNSTDSPSEEHLAEHRPDGKFYYVHPGLKNVKQHWGMTPTNPTPIEDFGITVEVDHGLLRGNQEFDSRAAYSDGRTRRWQGARRFSFFFSNAERIRAEPMK